MQVTADHGECHVALKAVEAMIGAAVEPMSLQGIDRRLHGGVPTAQAPEFRVGLAPRFGGVAFTFLGQYRKGLQLSELFLVRRAVKALIQADTVEVGKRWARTVTTGTTTGSSVSCDRTRSGYLRTAAC